MIKQNISKQTKPAKKSQAGNKKPKQKGSLGRNLLSQGASLLGGMLGPVGSSLAQNGANWLSDVLGMGDYEIKENSLMNANSGVPTFKESKHSVRIRHREYLGDITGSVAFSDRAYSINPGLETSFPWLSNVAYGFQQYRFHGLLYEFVSTSANALNSVNTALGTVVMSTQYNATLPNFLNKAEMEQYEFSCSTPPSKSLIHPVECNPEETPLDHLYVRAGAPPANSDLRMYDLGIFQLATVGMQAAANIGELWVTYDVEFFKPRIQPGGAYPGQFTRIDNGPYTASPDVLGSIQTNPKGTLGVTISNTNGGWDTIFFPSSITSGRYFVYVTWTGSVAAGLNITNPTFSNLTQQSLFKLGTANYVGCPFGGTSNATQGSIAFFVTVNGYSANGSSIVFSNAQTLPGTPSSCDVLVVALPLTDTYV